MDVVCIGGANIDYFHRTNTAPFEHKIGGVALNLANNLKKYGHHVKLVSAIGNDAHGNLLIDEMQKTGLDPQYIIRLENHHTATVYFEIKTDDSVSISQNNTNVHDHFTMNELQSLLTHIQDAAIWVVDTDLSAEALKSIANVKPIDCCLYTVVADPNKASRVQGILPTLEAVFLNQAEAITLTGQDINTIDEALNIAELIRQQGPKQVFLTLGKKGLIVSTPTINQAYPAMSKTSQEIRFHGAGDALAACIIDGLINHFPLEKTIQKALITAKMAEQC